MGQVTIYLDDETEKKMAKAARSANLSKSKWIARLIDEKVSSEWPLSIKDLVGAWRDFPSIDDLRKDKHYPTDRESF